MFLLSAAGAPALAQQSGSGYQSDYDYAGQGDDWYGRHNRVDAKRDFAPPVVDQIYSGEDFCQGYEKVFDRWGLGPPLFRTSARQIDYNFRFSEADASFPCIVGFVPPTCDDGNSCTFDAFDAATARCTYSAERDGLPCPDGSFCNGEESCLTGACVAGPPPSCDDGDACTIDFCDNFTNECFSFPQFPPGEVDNLILTPESLGGRTALLSWDPIHGADGYDLYRSTSGLVTELACFQSDLPSTVTTDLGDAPGTNKVFLFLPVAVQCGLEGSLGYSSSGLERFPWRPCR